MNTGKTIVALLAAYHIAATAVLVAPTQFGIPSGATPYVGLSMIVVTALLAVSKSLFGATRDEVVNDPK